MKCLLCDKDTREIIANRLRNGEKIKVRHCRSCDVAMLDDNRPDGDLKRFYSGQYRKIFKPVLGKTSDPSGLFSAYSRFQENRINLIKKFLTKKTVLLEVGCSAGMFLFNVKKHVRKVVGIDYDSRSAYWASRKCKCTVFDTDIEKTNLRKGTFDVICMFQVLEHVKDPRSFLKKYIEYLKPDGVICVEVPNLKDALIYAYDLPYHYNFYFHSAHLSYFTEKSLGILMKKAGFNGTVSYVQDYNILNHMHWISADTPQASCMPGLSYPSLPLRKTLEPGKQKELNGFIRTMDFQYKELLKKLKITSNLFYVGRKAK